MNRRGLFARLFGAVVAMVLPRKKTYTAPTLMRLTKELEDDDVLFRMRVLKEIEKTVEMINKCLTSTTRFG